MNKLLKTDNGFPHKFYYIIFTHKPPFVIFPDSAQFYILRWHEDLCSGMAMHHILF